MGRRVRKTFIFFGIFLSTTSLVRAKESSVLFSLSPRPAPVETEMRNSPPIRALFMASNRNTLTREDTVRSKAAVLETVKFQHYYDGIKVIGSMALHHQSRFRSYIQDDIKKFDVNTQPEITQDQAISLAMAIAEGSHDHASTQLAILPDTQSPSARLIYWVKLFRMGGVGGSDVLLDAHSGQILGHLSREYTLAPIQVYSAKERGLEIEPLLVKNPRTHQPQLAHCTIISLKDGTETIISRKECLDIYEGSSALTQDECQVVDRMSGFPLSIEPSACEQVVQNGNQIGEDKDPAIDRAASNSQKILNYYQTHFDRNSFDNQGSEAVTIVHGGIKMANAFWSVDQNIMVYGDGDGVQMADLTTALDVAGHEMTHGITSHTANLIMMNESGALSEALSDFFGKMIENEGDWIMGRKLFLTSENKGVRDLARPENLNAIVINAEGNPIEKPYPSKASEKAKIDSKSFCDNLNDQCWVHYNATIPGHAFYLMHQSLGQEKTEQLLYTTLTHKLTANESFESASKAILESCKDLGFAEQDCSAVKKILGEVEMLST